MDESTRTLVVSCLGLLTAVLVAGWNVGGRGALKRRTIKQELDIALALQEGPERQRLEQLARDRAALYVDSRTWVPLTEAQVQRLRVMTLLSPLAYALLAAMGSIDGVVGGLSWTLSGFAFVFFFAMLGYWVGRWVRYGRVRRRDRRIDEARGRLVSDR